MVKGKSSLAYRYFKTFEHTITYGKKVSKTFNDPVYTFQIKIQIVELTVIFIAISFFYK